MQDTAMVSTRGVKHKFTEGERVLCYEPDPTKAKVLYDSKVLGVVESKDKRGRRNIQYKIHFQGWNSSWDRRVNADYVLKDTEENRQLQRDLAEKAQLQLAAYLYRRERKKRNRKEYIANNNSSSNINNTLETSSVKSRNRGSVEDDSSCSTFERNDNDFSRDEQMLECETCSTSSSVESGYDEDRVKLKISERLKQYLEFDYDMIHNKKKLCDLPAQMPAITILENFVKQNAIKLVFCSSQTDSTRRRNPNLRPEKREKDFDKLINTINLLKEVADGLRLYLDFTLKDYLLYKEEKSQVDFLLSDENLQVFSYVPMQMPSIDSFNIKIDSSDSTPNEHLPDIKLNDTHQDESNSKEDNARRRLRSYRNEENDILIDNCFSSVASTSSGSSTPHANVATSSIPGILKPSSSLTIPVKVKEFLQEVFSWQILPSDAEPESSMIFGAIHLARLIVKLPDFLNASTMPDEKLKTLLQHLDLFVTYLEVHKEWFDEHNYKEIKYISVNNSNKSLKN